MSGDPAEPRDDADRYDDFYDDEIPEGMVVCDRCNGDGTIDCMCCGDFCCCGANDELDCPVCHGEQYITKARWEKRRDAHHEMMKALWPGHYAKAEPAADEPPHTPTTADKGDVQ